MRRLVIDTETTGLSPRYNKTLTVGMLLIDVNTQHLKILDENHIFIKHENYNTNSEALKVNKIDINDHNKIAVKPKIACEQINSFLDKNILHETPLIGHNIQFDKGFLNSLFNQGESQYNFHHESFDTMHLWRGLQKSRKVPSEIRANLQSISNFFNIDYSKAHDALADCHITSKVYHRMLNL
jgi:DNA polymerase III alpha subunit (gram-positive type)